MHVQDNYTNRDAVKSQILSTPFLPEEAMLTREILSSIRIDQEGKTMVDEDEGNGS